MDETKQHRGERLQLRIDYTGADQPSWRLVRDIDNIGQAHDIALSGRQADQRDGGQTSFTVIYWRTDGDRSTLVGFERI